MTGCGNLLLKGEGVAQNTTAALEWYERAVEQDDLSAMNGLGFIHFFGRAGQVANQTRALQYFEKNLRDGDSLFNAGYMYLNALGTDLDVKRGVDLLEQAAHNFGHFDAIHALSRVHLEGPPLAEWSTKTPPSIREGESREAYEHRMGKNYVRSCPHALKYLRAAAQHGDWSKALRRGFDAYLERDANSAFVNYIEGSELGYVAAASNAAWLLRSKLVSYPRGNTANSIFRQTCDDKAADFESWRQFSRAAKEGSAEAELRLGDLAFRGVYSSATNEMNGAQICPADNCVEKAIAHWQRSVGPSETDAERASVAADGLETGRARAEACYNLGWAHEYGYVRGELVKTLLTSESQLPSLPIKATMLSASMLLRAEQLYERALRLSGDDLGDHEARGRRVAINSALWRIWFRRRLRMWGARRAEEVFVSITAGSQGWDESVNIISEALNESYSFALSNDDCVILMLCALLVLATLILWLRRQSMEQLCISTEATLTNPENNIHTSSQHTMQHATREVESSTPTLQNSDGRLSPILAETTTTGSGIPETSSQPVTNCSACSRDHIESNSKVHVAGVAQATTTSEGGDGRLSRLAEEVSRLQDAVAKERNKANGLAAANKALEATSNTNR